MGGWVGGSAGGSVGRSVGRSVGASDDRSVGRSEKNKLLLTNYVGTTCRDPRRLLSNDSGVVFPRTMYKAP